MTWTTGSIGDLSGKRAVVTGANSGLGLEATRTLAKHGATVYLAVRNLEKGAAAVDQVTAEHPAADVHLQQLDLASLDSIRDSASELRDRLDSIDLLINNAGVMYAAQERTADGFGMQFGTNHLGHFAWTGRLIDLLLERPGSRVVTHSSVGHRLVRHTDADDPRAEGAGNPAVRYNRSKLANLRFTYELQRRLEASSALTMAVAAHPGLSETTLLSDQPGAGLLRPFMSWMTQDVKQGVLPLVRAATDPGVVGGQFFGPDGFMQSSGEPVLVRSSRQSHDTAAQQHLWGVSEQLTGVTFKLD